MTENGNGQRNPGQPAKEIFFVNGVRAGSLSWDKRREGFIKERKKMTTTGVTSGANYSIFM